MRESRAEALLLAAADVRVGAAAAGAAATEMVPEAAAVAPAETGTAATTLIYHPIL